MAAAVIGVGDDHHGLAGCGAQQECCDAMDAGVDGAGEYRILAVGRALERDHLDGVTGGSKFLIEIGRNAVDKLQGPNLENFILGMNFRGERDRNCCDEDGQCKLEGPGEHGNPLWMTARPAACGERA